MNIAVQTAPAAASTTGFRDHKVTACDCSVYYGEKHALKNVSIDIPDRGVTSFIGPSGCGKSTFLRCINRMNDTIPIARVTGKIEIDVVQRMLVAIEHVDTPRDHFGRSGRRGGRCRMFELNH